MSTDDPFKTGGGLNELKSVLDGSRDPLLGKVIGNYRIAELIAEGGMGRVYKAARNDGQFDRDVAIKVLPPGMAGERVRRFEQEQKILADLSHPNIAQLYDAGLSDSNGLFLVMELIDGIPIDEYTRREHLGSNAKVRLILTLCDALALAHGKLVIHRDLKPSNVFVSNEGHLKLLDFGIAKILELPGDVTAEARPMTPGYASPEQLLNESASVASDIYQVGLLFLSLYTRRPELPDDTVESAIDRIVKETPLTVASQVTEKLPAELAAIINKCLRIEPEKRYLSSAELAADLQNFLDGYPVSARNPGRLQRGIKFARRNILATLAVSTTIVALASFLTISVQQQAATESARQEAETEGRRAEKVTEFLVDLFEANNPSQHLGEELSARDILDRGTQQLQKLDDQPDLKADLLETLADTYTNIGDLYTATELVAESLQIKEELYADEPLKIASTLRLMARMHIWRDQLDEALELSQRAYEIRKDAFGEHNEATLSALATVGYTLQKMWRLDEAEEVLQTVIDGRKVVHGEYHEKVTTAINNLSGVYYYRGDTDKALELMREVLKRNETELPLEHPAVSNDWFNYGNSLRLAGRYEESVDAIKKSLEIQIKVRLTENPLFPISRYYLSLAQDANGTHDDAVETMTASYASAQVIFRRLHPDLILIEAALGELLSKYGDPRRAGELLDSAYTQQVERFGADSSNTLFVKWKMGELRLAEGKPAEALTILEPLAERYKEEPRLFEIHGTLAHAYSQLGAFEKALSSITTGQQAIADAEAQDKPGGGNGYLAFAMTYLAMDRHADATAMLRKAIAANKKLGAEHWKHQVESALGVMIAAGRTDEPLDRAQVLAVLQKLELILPKTHVYVAFIRDYLESI